MFPFKSAGKRVNEAEASDKADIAGMLLRKRDRSEILSKLCLGFLALEVFALLLGLVFSLPSISSATMIQIDAVLIGAACLLALMFVHFASRVKQYQRRLDQL